MSLTTRSYSGDPILLSLRLKPQLSNPDSLAQMRISWAFVVPGLAIGVGIYQHVAAKYVFV